MYAYLLPLHSWLRWALVLGVLWGVVRGAAGVAGGARFTKADNFFRSFTSGTSHAQLLLGLALYIQSPLVQAFRGNMRLGMREPGLWFFGIFHLACMVTAVVLITIGTARARRLTGHREKHRAILIWCGSAAILLLLAIPWPIHPFAVRPLFRF